MKFSKPSLDIFASAADIPIEFLENSGGSELWCKRLMWKKTLWKMTAFSAALIGLVVLFGSLYSFKAYRARTAAGPTGTGPAATPIAAVVARSGPLPEYLEAIGSLKAVRQVVIAPEVGGMVKAIHFESGGTVSAGAPILQINDGPDRGDLERYQGQLWYAEREFDRSQRLIAATAVSKSEADATKSRVVEARGQIARTEAVIAQKKLCAPFAGVLGIRQVDQGQYLQPGQPVVSLTDLDALYVNFTLPEQSLPRLNTGQSIEVLVDAFPGQPFPAVVSTIEPQVYAESRTVPVQGTLDNRDHVLRPGMFASVRVVLPSGPDVVTVPETSLDRTIAGDSVFVVRAKGKGQVAERVPVKAGRRVGGRVAIAAGVKAGDLVVSSGQVNLAPGSPVSVTDAGTPPVGKELASKGSQP
ncbi:RND family efflux transporter, MFP subunit [Singulisphaera acidiphila DSM 18658]|uniref:RND family efflux transporter, MFP subunit n=2 Tax=Singulisphaera acidiphila TaxID=466153 RepID=L0DCB0_SINAD|nr:RND family efflux transporter, MFP subunit [Singulisphaera acidiphila DSM 18658]